MTNNFSNLWSKFGRCKLQIFNLQSKKLYGTGPRTTHNLLLINFRRFLMTKDIKEVV